MQFAFRRPPLPCIGIAGDYAYAIFKSNQFDRLIKKDPSKVVHFYDGRGEGHEYHPDLGLVAPEFLMKVYTKQQIRDAVFACANMADSDTPIRKKNLSNIRLDELIFELCRAIDDTGS